jgi:hypothetical protein
MGVLRNLGTAALLASAFVHPKSLRADSCLPPEAYSCYYYLGVCQTWFPEQCDMWIGSDYSYEYAEQYCVEDAWSSGCPGYGTSVQFDYTYGCWACVLGY